VLRPDGANEHPKDAVHRGGEEAGREDEKNLLEKEAVDVVDVLGRPHPPNPAEDLAEAADSDHLGEQEGAVRRRDRRLAQVSFATSNACLNVDYAAFEHHKEIPQSLRPSTIPSTELARRGERSTVG